MPVDKNSTGILIMDNSVFNPNYQDENLSSKIVSGLERVSEVFKILLWEKAKQVSLSPIQIQILIFVNYHKQGLCNVSHLSKEFNVTKPTISDAVKILDKKQLILKDYSSSDSRSYSIHLSQLGKQTIFEIYDFANPLKQQVDKFKEAEQESVFKTLSELIYKLNQNGTLTVQRTCFACKYYQKQGDLDYCRLLERELLNKDIRLDCPEFEEKN